MIFQFEQRRLRPTELPKGVQKVQLISGPDSALHCPAQSTQFLREKIGKRQICTKPDNKKKKIITIIIRTLK